MTFDYYWILARNISKFVWEKPMAFQTHELIPMILYSLCFNNMRTRTNSNILLLLTGHGYSRLSRIYISASLSIALFSFLQFLFLFFLFSMIYVNDSAESGMGRRRIFRVHVQYTFFVSLFVVIFLLYVFFLSVVLKPIGIENGRACPIINGRYAYTFPMAGVEQSLKPDKHISRLYNISIPSPDSRLRTGCRANVLHWCFVRVVWPCWSIRCRTHRTTHICV